MEPLDPKVTFYNAKTYIARLPHFYIRWCIVHVCVSLSPLAGRTLSVMLLLWAEMWTGFRSSRKELMFYLSAGTPWTHTHCLTMICTRRHARLIKMILVVFSGAIAGTPFDIDRELLRKGQAPAKCLRAFLLELSFTCVLFISEICIFKN